MIQVRVEGAPALAEQPYEPRGETMLDWFDHHPLDGVRAWASPLYWNEWAGFARHDTPEAVIYTMSVPGYRRKDIAIEVSGRRVVVRGERSDGFHRPQSVSFEQWFTLPDILDEQDLRADLRDGVLSISVAKRPAARPRRIPITEGDQVPPAPLAAAARAEPGSWWRRLRAKIRREPALSASH